MSNMMNDKRLFSPPEVIREYRKLYVIAVEGDQAESSYFQYLGNDLDTTVTEIKIIPPKSKSAPQHVLKKIQDYLDNPSPDGTFECWIVIDRDYWKVETLDSVVKACQEQGIGLCVSNPAFEFWLLLHFEDGTGIQSAETAIPRSSSVKACKERIRDKQYLLKFGKKLRNDHWMVLRDKLKDAIQRAKELNIPPCDDYPKNRTGSTVYLLVEKLVEG